MCVTVSVSETYHLSPSGGVLHFKNINFLKHLQNRIKSNQIFVCVKEGKSNEVFYCFKQHASRGEAILSWEI